MACYPLARAYSQGDALPQAIRFVGLVESLRDNVTRRQTRRLEVRLRDHENHTARFVLWRDHAVLAATHLRVGDVASIRGAMPENGARGDAGVVFSRCCADARVEWRRGADSGVRSAAARAVVAWARATAPPPPAAPAAAAAAPPPPGADASTAVGLSLGVTMLRARDDVWVVAAFDGLADGCDAAADDGAAAVEAARDGGDAYRLRLALRDGDTALRCELAPAFGRALLGCVPPRDVREDAPGARATVGAHIRALDGARCRVPLLLAASDPPTILRGGLLRLGPPRRGGLKRRH